MKNRGFFVSIITLALIALVSCSNKSNLTLYVPYFLYHPRHISMKLDAVIYLFRPSLLLTMTSIKSGVDLSRLTSEASLLRGFALKDNDVRPPPTPRRLYNAPHTPPRTTLSYFVGRLLITFQSPRKAAPYEFFTPAPQLAPLCPGCKGIPPPNSAFQLIPISEVRTIPGSPVPIVATTATQSPEQSTNPVTLVHATTTSPLSVSQLGYSHRNWKYT